MTDTYKTVVVTDLYHQKHGIAKTTVAADVEFQGRDIGAGWVEWVAGGIVHGVVHLGDVERIGETALTLDQLREKKRAMVLALIDLDAAIHHAEVNIVTGQITYILDRMAAHD